VHIQSRTDSYDVNGMMAMVIIGMMIVFVMVNIVPECNGTAARDVSRTG
jgi:hypothetical protein